MLRRVFSGFVMMVLGLGVMTMSEVGVVTRLLVVAGLSVLLCFVMVLRGVLVMLGCVRMVLSVRVMINHHSLGAPRCFRGGARCLCPQEEAFKTANCGVLSQHSLNPIGFSICSLTPFKQKALSSHQRQKALNDSYPLPCYRHERWQACRGLSTLAQMAILFRVIKSDHRRTIGMTMFKPEPLTKADLAHAADKHVAAILTVAKIAKSLTEFETPEKYVAEYHVMLKALVDAKPENSA